MDQMKRISKQRTETLARVVRRMLDSECLGGLMQRTKAESGVRAMALRKEHAEDMADVLLVS